MSVFPQILTHFAMLLALLLLFSTPLLHATTADDLATANSALVQGNTAEAIRGYETLIRHGEIRAEIYSNLGTAWQRSGDPAHALLNYERALLLNPALTAARTGLQRVSPPAPGPWWSQFPQFGANISILAGTIAVWILLLALVARWRRLLGTVNLWTFLAVLAVLAVALCSASYFYRDAPLASPNRAVVLAPAKLRATFSDNSGVLTNLSPASVVEIVSDNGPWTNCRLADGTQGWLDSKLIERVVPH